MWDWFRQTIGQVAQAGTEYLEYRQFILLLFDLPQEQAYLALKQKVFSMEDAEIQRFYGVVIALIQEAQQSVQQIEARSSWGNTFEDRVAQFDANYRAGFPPNQAVQQAQMVLQGLVAVAQYAEQFYQEKLAQIPPATQPPVQNLSTPSKPTREYPQAETAPGRQNVPPSVQPIDDLEKGQRFMELQMRHMQAMPNIMPGKATPQVVDEFLDILNGYEGLLQAGPPEFEFYTLDSLKNNMADALDKLARTLETLQSYDRAMNYYEQAAAAYDRIGQPEKAAECRTNIARFQSSKSGNYDQEIIRLKTEMAPLTPNTLPYISRVVELGQIKIKAGDDLAAEADLEKALELLAQAGFPEPQGPGTVDLLRQAAAAPAEKRGQLLQQAELQATVRGLYQNIYFSLTQIYRDLPDADDKTGYWQEKEERLREEQVSQEDILNLQNSIRGIGR